MISNTNSNQYGVSILTGSVNEIKTISSCNNNSQRGIQFGNASTNKIGSLTTSGNLSSVSIGVGVNYIEKMSLAEATDVAQMQDFADSKIFINKYNGTNYSKIVTDGGYIVSQASTLTNGSGTEWKFTTATTTNRSLSPNNYPLTLSIAKIAVTANNAVTVTAWCKKGHATNIGARLVCRGGQLAGVVADVYDEKANDTNEEQLTISFTPTESGVIEIEAWAYYVAGHSTVIFDAMTITQA